MHRLPMILLPILCVTLTTAAQAQKVQTLPPTCRRL